VAACSEQQPVLPHLCWAAAYCYCLYLTFVRQSQVPAKLAAVCESLCVLHKHQLPEVLRHVAEMHHELAEVYSHLGQEQGKAPCRGRKSLD